MNKNTCLCCGFKTIDGDGDYDICPICFWEDDPFQKEYIEELGANKVSLVEAQKNYIQYGVCEVQFTNNVRKPNNQDKKDPNWKPLSDYPYGLKLTCKRFIEGKDTIADIENKLSYLEEIPEELKKYVNKAVHDIEMIRFCSNDNKKYDETLEVVNNLLKDLNIVIDFDE